MVKQFFKRLIQNHLGRFLFPILRLVFQPSVQLRKSLLFKGKIRVRLEPSLDFKMINHNFYLETDLFWLGYDRHEWEKMSRKLWSHLCKSSKVILDIGANTGIYSLIAKTINNHAVVYAFEPQPNIFKILEENVKANSYHIHCIKKALSNTIGFQNFYNYGKDTFTQLNTTAGSLNESWNTNRDAQQRSINIETTTLDSVIDTLSIEPVDLIKLDVETYEPEVLEGYSKYLLKHRPIIIAEIQNETIGNRISNILKFASYKFFLINEESGLSECLELGFALEYNNHCLCPEEKTHFLKLT